MAKCRSTLLMLAALLAGCSGRQESSLEWRDFSDAEGKFSMLMPGAPERETYEMPIISGSMNFVSNAVDMPHEARYFAAVFVDYPPESVGKGEVLVHQLMDRYVTGGAKIRN